MRFITADCWDVTTAV